MVNMTNTCMNTLTIRGENIDLKEFMDCVVDKVSPFSLQKIYPIPDVLINASLIFSEEQRDFLMEKVGYNNILEWKKNEWGSISINCKETQPQINEKEIIYVFSSVSVAPIKAILVGSVRFPNIKFNILYERLYVDIFGFVDVQNGKILEQKELSYSEEHFAKLELTDVSTDKNKIILSFLFSWKMNPYNFKEKEKERVMFSMSCSIMENFLVLSPKLFIEIAEKTKEVSLIPIECGDVNSLLLEVLENQWNGVKIQLEQQQLLRNIEVVVKNNKLNKM